LQSHRGAKIRKNPTDARHFINLLADENLKNWLKNAIRTRLAAAGIFYPARILQSEI
jgi:hypothetical protein